MEEQWKNLKPPFDDYSISNFGRIRNKKGQEIKPTAHCCGKDKKYAYPTIHLCIRRNKQNIYKFTSLAGEVYKAFGKGRICVTGVRAAESVSRAKKGGEAKIFGGNGVEVIHNMDNDENRRMIEQCYRTRKTLINPIIDWTDDDIWEFSKAENIKQNPLYIQCGGTKKRLGCILLSYGKN